MRVLATAIVLLSMGCLFAQEESMKKERYERYENGELVEQDFSVEKDGVPIENYDFGSDEFFSEKSLDEMTAKFDIKRAEMQNKMDAMQKKMDVRMKSTMADMEKRMADMQERSKKMRQDMEKRMNDSQKKMESGRESKEFSPQSESKPTSTFQTFGA